MTPESPTRTTGPAHVAVICDGEFDLTPAMRTLQPDGRLGVRLFVGRDMILPESCLGFPMTILDDRMSVAGRERLIVIECLMREVATEYFYFVMAHRVNEIVIRHWIDRVDALRHSLQDRVVVTAADNPAVIGVSRDLAKRMLLDREVFDSQSAVEGDSSLLGQGIVQTAIRAGGQIEIVAQEKVAPHDAYLANAVEPQRFEVAGAAVSIVVPTWNCGDYLPGCLDSLLSQTAKAEVVVVDDASDDQTTEILQSYGDRITVIRHARRRGANAARNTAIAAAQGDLIAFADADNQYERTWLEKLVKAIRSDRTAGVAFCGYTKQSADRSCVTNPAAQWDTDLLWYANYIDMSSIVRRSAIPKDGLHEGFRPFDDWRLWLSLARDGWTGVWVSEKLFTKHVRKSGKTESSTADPDGRSRDIAAVRREFAELVGLGNPIAVVIPACGCDDLTAKCLEHLGRYSGLPLEVFYIDNGSPLQVIDNVVIAASEADLKLRVIRNRTNLGFTHAVNQGIDAAGHRDVLLLNNDCFVGPGCLENLARELKFNQQIAAVGPLTGDDGKQSLKEERIRRLLGLPSSILDALHDPVHVASRLNQQLRSISEPVLSFYCALLRRSALDRFGSLDPQFESGLGADDEWCFRVGRAGRQVRVVLNAYAAHLHRSTFERLALERDELQSVAQAQLHRVLADDDDELESDSTASPTNRSARR